MRRDLPPVPGGAAHGSIRGYTPARARLIASSLTEMDQDGWVYVAKDDPKGTGFSLVRIYDEDGEHIGYY